MEKLPIPLDDREFRPVWEALDDSERASVARSVRRGEVVENGNPGFAALAVALAVRRTSWLRAYAVIGAALGAGGVYMLAQIYTDGVSFWYWWQLAFAFVWLVDVPTLALIQIRRLRRAERLNRALVEIDASTEP